MKNFVDSIYEHLGSEELLSIIDKDGKKLDNTDVLLVASKEPYLLNVTPNQELHTFTETYNLFLDGITFAGSWNTYTVQYKFINNINAYKLSLEQ